MLIGENWLTLSDSEGHRRLDHSDDFVRVEIAAALERGIPIIPVLLDGARMPRPEELPESIAALSRRQAVSIRHAQFSHDAEPLIERLERLSPAATFRGGRPDAPVEPLGRRKGAIQFGIRRKWVALTVAALFIIMGLGLVVWRTQSPRPDRVKPIDLDDAVSFKPLVSANVGTLQSAEELGLRRKVRPVLPGTSVGTIDAKGKGTGSGTICCIVRSSDGSQYIVSDIAAFRGSVVIQPGPADQGREGDQIGTLVTRVELDSQTRYDAFAGIARLLPGTAVSNQIPGLGRMGDLIGDLQPGQTVRMVGRTSGLVEGKVTAVNVTESIVGYLGSPVSVRGLIRTTQLSQGGDAGAPVLTTNNELVGMVVAGSEDATIVMPLQDLFKNWKVELIR